MAKKSSPRTAAKTDKKTTTAAATPTKKPAATKSTSRKAPKSSAKSSAKSGSVSGLFLPGGSDKQTAEEKSLANAVTAAGGTDKLLAILKHIDAAGGASAALGALEVYERMRRVLNPTNSDSVAHPLFESLESDKEDDSKES